jgi:hypothetical protein
VSKIFICRKIILISSYGGESESEEENPPKEDAQVSTKQYFICFVGFFFVSFVDCFPPFFV